MENMNKVYNSFEKANMDRVIYLLEDIKNRLDNIKVNSNGLVELKNEQ